jgi:hypothetical protein
LGSEGYSPGVLQKIEYAGGNGRSFELAAESLGRLAEFSISAKHVERVTEKLGRERAKARDGEAEAMKRKMYAAPKRAFIGDGGNWIEPLGDMHFAGWIQILDFLHLLVHLFAAARIAFADATRAWKLYEQMLRDAWAGRVQEVIDALQLQLDRLRAAGTPESTGTAACRVVELALNYVERNRQRMDYPRYRRLGLPVSSSLIESLIKQINHRVKGTEQFWNDGGLEAVLQVRAAYLSQDGRAETFHEHRPRSPAVGRNRHKPFQPAG